MATVSEERASALPRWDLTSAFPSLDSPEFAAGFEDVVRGMAALAELFDARGIGALDAAPDPAEAGPVFDEIVGRLNGLLEDASTLLSYILAHVTTDSRGAAAQARLSELERHQVLLRKLETRLVAWIGSVDVDALLDTSEEAREHAFFVRRGKEAAAHLMSRPEEELAAELDLSGATAWSKLHQNVTSQLAVPLEVDGEMRERPMTEIRNLAHDPDRDVRRSAFEAELEAWERVGVPLAAALNSIKGQVNTLVERRRWESPLDAALFGNSIDQATLDAMLSAVREALPELRRYLRAKARVLGIDVLAWYDVFAPVRLSPHGESDAQRTWEYGEAEDFIVEQFGTYSDRMRDFAARAFAERWIDAEPRIGKTGGAFCMPFRADESRILTNYKASYYAMSTLAHELGHGYHNLVKAHVTPLRRRTPMTLAETASIMCETIVRSAALAEASPAEQLEILEGSLQDNAQTTVDILSRFLFEGRVFEQRRERELSVEELCELMLAAQRETYGEGLDQDTLHPYMWAVKPHYYSERSFYNFPYTFGLLFGLGLYARYQADPESFRAGYDELLASTGSADAAELAARFDIDVRTLEFWRSSLRVIVDDIDRFEALAEQLAS